MREILYRDLHKSVLAPFDFGDLVTELLSRVVAGSDKAEDYETLVRKDGFFTKTICSHASKNLKMVNVNSIAHAVVVVGQNKVRNFILGHSISRLFSPQADTAFQSMDEGEAKLKFTLRAEEHAKKIKNEYVGLALSSAYIFDIFAQWVATDPVKFQLYEPFVESSWRHGLRTATLAWALATHPRVFISHRKIIFSLGLLHDIGQLALAFFDPDNYQPCLEKVRESRSSHPTDDSYVADFEHEGFDLAHPEVGSALIAHTRVLKELEMEIDFHHDIGLLRVRNPDAFLGAAVVSIADRLAYMSEHTPGFANAEVEEVLKPHREYFPLHAHEVIDVFAQVRSRGWL